MNTLLKSNISVGLLFFLYALPLTSCSGSDDENEAGYVAGFEYEFDSSNPNMVNFTNTSEGDYLYVQWDFGNGKTSSKSTDKTSVWSSHYIQKGSYEVTLTIWGPLNAISDTKTITKTITIANDDPDFTGGEYQLVWSDEFDQPTVNLNYWTFETGADGWGNQELQNYTNGDNAHIENGNLVITAKKVNDNKEVGSYTSTRMVTKGKQEFTYGKIEVRAKLPSGTGIWPAIWMLGGNIGSVGWPACGEIDIMEYVGYQPNVIHSTVHTSAGYAGDGDGSSKTLNTAEEEFHIYGMIWTETEITFYVDTPDNVVHVYGPSSKNASNWPFDKPQFFILNIAVGGTWGGAQGIDNSIFPQTMEIDYVRVYQLQ